MFTEKQLQTSAELQSVISLQKFILVYNNNADKFQSITICLRNSIDTNSHTKMNGSSCIKL